MSFTLHPNLSTKPFIIDLPLCRVLLENDLFYPWILLVPRRNDISRLMDLEFSDQLLCLKELDVAQHILWQQFELIQINVAAIGNKTPQLHIHVIGRQINDPAWPGTVWDHPTHQPYTNLEQEQRISTLRNAFTLAFKAI